MEKKVTKQEARRIWSENGKRVVDDSVDGFVVLKDIDKVYDNRVQAVFNFNLSVKQNEFIVLVGPSGCGKSTTLRMIAGLEDITNGYLYIDKVLSNYLESKDRDIAMVFQSYALYPNMNVYDNIGFGLKARHVPKEVIREKVYEAEKILDLGPYLDRKPKELSGGQMQRVALGRAIVRNAKLFLMDEPLSNLDAKLRVQMRSEIVALHRRIGATTIYVTHDQTEAMTMADRIVVMNKGIVQQIGAPMEIYNDPANVFVATFIGNPPMNVFAADISTGELTIGDAKIALPRGSAEYARHIEERRQFFEDFRRKADLSREKELIAEAGRISSSLKKLAPEELSARISALCNELEALSAEKGFFEFGAENREVIEQDAAARDIASVRHDLDEIVTQLRDVALQVAGILQKFDSAGEFRAKESAPVAGDEHKKKHEKQPTIEESNIQMIEAYLASYSAPEAAKQAVIGIRPEDIHLYDKFTGNKSNPITVRATFVELLGSEYCVYIDLPECRLIMKTGIDRVIRTGDELKICFNMDKLRIFDKISGARVV